MATTTPRYDKTVATGLRLPEPLHQAAEDWVKALKDAGVALHLVGMRPDVEPSLNELVIAGLYLLLARQARGVRNMGPWDSSLRMDKKPCPASLLLAAGRVRQQLDAVSRNSTATRP